jgi:hypothetical protein
MEAAGMTFDRHVWSLAIGGGSTTAGVHEIGLVHPSSPVGIERLHQKSDAFRNQRFVHGWRTSRISAALRFQNPL